MTTQSKLFSERQAYWTSQGLAGRAVYDALSTDTELPSFFDEQDLSAITGLTTHAFKARRIKKMQPEFSRMSASCVRYPREAFCRWLADILKSQQTEKAA